MDPTTISLKQYIFKQNSLKMDGSTITEVPTMIKKFTNPGDILIDLACGPGHTLVKS